MFGEFVRQWYRLVFWWLPSDQKDQPDREAPKPSEAPKRSEASKQPETSKPSGASKPSEATASQSAPAPAAKTAAKPAAQATGASDDLTEIKGIGPTIDKRLRAMGIGSFRDLAQADAQDIARKLNSRPVTAERVGEWIAAAKKRSGS